LLIAMRAFYALSLWITFRFCFTYPDLHHGLLESSDAVRASGPMKATHCWASHQDENITHAMSNNF